MKDGHVKDTAQDVAEDVTQDVAEDVADASIKKLRQTNPNKSKLTSGFDFR